MKQQNAFHLLRVHGGFSHIYCVCKYICTYIRTYACTKCLTNLLRVTINIPCHSFGLCFTSYCSNTISVKFNITHINIDWRNNIFVLFHRLDANLINQISIICNLIGRQSGVLHTAPFYSNFIV